MLDPVGGATPVVAQPAGEIREHAVGLLRLARRAEIIDAGRHHRDADDALETWIEGRADDDVGVLVGLVADAGGGFINLEQRQVLAAGDGNDETAGALDRGILDQGIGNRSNAALSTRLSPEASPLPIMALPFSRMTDRTSAKSRLIRPSLTMRSLMQATPE